MQISRLLQKNCFQALSLLLLIINFAVHCTAEQITSSVVKSSQSKNVSSSSSSSSSSQNRAAFIRDMAREAWAAYERYGWPADSVRGWSKGPANVHFGPHSGHSIVAALSTLWVMGLTEQFDRARAWVAGRGESLGGGGGGGGLSFGSQDELVNVHRTMVQFVGGLLSAYSLSEDEIFLQRAVEVVDSLEPAWRTPTDLPSESVNPKQGFHLGAINSLSGVGGHQLELLVLAQLTGNSSYSDRVARLRRFLQRNIQKQFYNAHAGYMDWVDVQAGTWFYTTTTSGSGSGGSPGITGRKTLPTESLTVSFSSDGADYYRSLLSTFLQNPTSSDSATAESWILLEEALRSALRIGLFAASPNSSLIYSRSYSYSSDTYGDHMTADSCYLGGLLATSGRLLEDRLSANRSLGAADRKQELQLVHQLAVLAEGIAKTCSAVSRATNSGLPPSRWYFNAAQEDGTNVGGSLETLFEKSYDLSGELAESYFVLHRLTGEEKYRTAAWELAQAIYRHCRIEGEVGVAAYAGLADVDLVPRTRNLGPGHQPAIFLSATLKYLYLIFSEGTVLPLDQWVFNTAGHPLPIRK